MAVYHIKGSAFGGEGACLVNVPDGANVNECVESWIVKENTRLKRKFGGKFSVTFTLHSIGDIVKGLEGVDQWGKFYNLTGCESVGSCFWCGRKNRSRYCCESHRLQYLRTYNWSSANRWCWERYASQCGMCFKKYEIWKVERSRYDYRTYEVHHMKPMAGGFRTWSILNRPENLILLCPDCHNSTKRKDFAGFPEPKQSEQLVLM